MGMTLPYSRQRVAATLAAAASLASIATASPAQALARPLTNPKAIQALASKAYVWGLAPEFVYRFQHYNTLVTAPLNNLGGGITAAAWNNQGTNAGDASVLYANAMLDLSGQRGRGGTKELVLTVPPSQSNYYVANLLDGYVNSMGSIGTRTTPSNKPQTYLIVGPTSQYAHKRIARIHGFTYRVMAMDTNLGWILIRMRADTLVPASDPASAASVVKNVAGRFALSTLASFEAHGHRPQYFQPGSYTPTQDQIDSAKQWQTAPTSAQAFFEQVGQSLRLSPLPTATTGLNGIPLSTLPNWVVPQSGATKLFRNPSWGQRYTLALFKPLGLSASGFSVPEGWGPTQLAALQAGYQQGQANVASKLTSVGVGPSTNYWNYLNTKIGTYPNTPQGYFYRAAVIVSGGSANVPLDGVYAQINNINGTSATQLNGNNTYTLTFTPPVTNPSSLPVIGTLPPLVNDSQGNPLGFWSVNLYQMDNTESSAPFISQASVLNTAYSTANIPVTAVDTSTNTITVNPSAWGPLVASTPIMFGSTAAQYGLKPDVAYYVASPPQQNTDAKTGSTTYSFQISTKWIQPLSPGNVPIQGSKGTPGPIVALSNPGGPVDLEWGPIQPVSQLGSQQLTSGKLVRNANGSVTIWIGPKPPPNAPETNWLPTPSAWYYSTIYPGVSVPTLIRPMIRMYYPTPGSNTQASILPPPNRSMGATYVFPAIQQVN
jgi:hypothetical protein